jgi:hypothetical protein
VQFLRFKDVCKQAYLIVRRQASLLINLLNMMLCTGMVKSFSQPFLRSCLSALSFTPLTYARHTGIPELQSHEDVDYLRETLCLGLTEEAAADNFMKEVCLRFSLR